MKHPIVNFLVCFLALVLCASAKAGSALVAVAANVAPVVAIIAKRYEASTGHSIRISQGASGTLTQQIIRGAPFELFLSADGDYPAHLCELDLCAQAPKHYVTGRLVLYLESDSKPLYPENGLRRETARALLVGGQSMRLAIANPAHAPYGRAAREVLEYLDVWSAFDSRLIVGESVSQTTRFASTGAVTAAILPRSLASQLPRQSWMLIPPDWHKPLHQRLVLLHGAGDVARDFSRYLLSMAAREIFSKHGYDLPVMDN